MSGKGTGPKKGDDTVVVAAVLLVFVMALGAPYVDRAKVAAGSAWDSASAWADQARQELPGYHPAAAP